MEATMTLVEGAYAFPTPAGVFYAVGSEESDAARTLLLNLLAGGAKKPLSRSALAHLAETKNPDHALSLLYRLQRLNFVRGISVPREDPPDGALDELLPPLLARLAPSGKALLMNRGGSQIARSGFPYEVAEELAALAVSLGEVYDQHKPVLKGNLKQASEAFALVAPDGRSLLGIWPLHLRQERVYLCVEGPPQFNHEAFSSAVQLLAVRYQS
jgi:hypothetical protein